MNDLFDNLNSRKKFSKNPNKNAILEEEEGVDSVIKNLIEAKLWVDNLHTTNSNSKRPPCFDGLSQTILGILLLWDQLKEDPDQEYLLTGHLNQDPLENLFSKVRSDKGSFEMNPSIFRVTRILKQLCFNTNTTPEKNSYEIADHMTNLLNMEDMPVAGELQIKINNESRP